MACKPADRLALRAGRRDGSDRPRIDAERRRWHGRSAADARTALALALEAQTEKDYRATLRWLRTSAEAGFRPAQEMLGMALLGGPALFGNAVQRQPCEALDWFIRAADQGSEIGRAHRNLLNRQPLGWRCR